jgi:hypothetical protein
VEKWDLKTVMYRVISNGESKRFTTLDLAMSYAKSLGTFVMITGGEFEIVGKFGVDEVKDPNYNGWISRKK